MALSQKNLEKINPYQTLTLLIAFSALMISGWSLISKNPVPSEQATPAETTLARIKRTGVMRVGYGGFPPYTIVNPNETDPNKRVSGFAVDMVNEIASRMEPQVKVEWHNLNWGAFRADMLSGRFDFLADATYKVIPKAADFNFSRTFSYFGLSAAIVRKDDDRFKTFKDLDQPGVVVTLAQGYITTSYAQKNLTKPTLKILPVGDDAFSPMNEVILGRADVALNDVPTVLQFARAHPNEVKALWVETPPSSVAAGFVTRREDTELNEFLNTAIEILEVDGTLKRLDQKWRSLGHFEQLNLVPGEGLNSN